MFTVIFVIISRVDAIISYFALVSVVVSVTAEVPKHLNSLSKLNTTRNIKIPRGIL